MVALLAMGANPNHVPKDMWCSFLEFPKRDPPPELSDCKEPEWCTSAVREILCRNFNLSQRYALWKASTIKKPKAARKQLAEAHGINELFEIPYHIIGQPYATQQVIERITSHLLFRPNESEPLVLLLTGTSGHGKTELARNMGRLLSLEIQLVDCASVRRAEDLFGSSPGYERSRESAPLINYLAANTGQRSVVFLDEIEKAPLDIWQRLLILFESGDSTDSRNHQGLDCSKTIWVLAGNLGSGTIAKFWDTHLRDRNSDQQLLAPFKELRRSLQKDAKMHFGAPFTGRITAIIPFVPFSKEEQGTMAFRLANSYVVGH